VKWNGGFTSAYASTHTSVADMVGSAGDFETRTWDEIPLLEGWDDVFVDWFNARGDVAVRHIQIPGMRFWLRQPYVDLVGQTRNPFSFHLERPTGNWITEYVGVLPYSGRTTTMFMSNLDNDPIRMKPGDHIVIDQPYSRFYDLPNIDATISASTDKVTVTSNCAQMGPGIVYVSVHRPNFSKSQYRTGPFNFNNQFVANFATGATYNITSGDKVDIYCRAMYGDIFAKTVTVP
jgi:hypothetical protein